MPLFCFTLFVLLIQSIILVNSSTYPKYAENANSCVDSCDGYFSPKYKINLDSGTYEAPESDKDLVELLDDFQNSDSSECSKNALLRIPFYKLLNGTIAKIELEYGDLPKGISFHVGNSPTNDLNGGDRNTTMHNSELYANETNLNYFMSSLSLCDQGVSIDDRSMDLAKLLVINETQSYIYPKTKIVLYVSEKWFRLDNLERNTSIYYNNKYLFTFSKPSEVSEKCESSSLNEAPYNKPSAYLYIGLNRIIADRSLTGAGLCSAEISFLNCHISPEPDMDIDVAQMDFKQRDRDNIAWSSHLSYQEPSMEHSPCSGQAVVKLKFEPNSTKKVARFDLNFGDLLSGFTFNLGDSPTNNGYGGDSGSTSNSAEIHSNDNRFYVWLNTKYCGDTLLYKIEYNLFQSQDEFTLFVSDQRLELSNQRGYHEVFKSPYLYNLNGQNVTCNCFDTRCYPGVQADEELYFGINRVIGGTYRPGVGLCRARISWLQCLTQVRRNESDVDSSLFVDWSNVPRRIGSDRVELDEESNRTESVNKTASDLSDVAISLNPTTENETTSTTKITTKSILSTLSGESSSTNQMPSTVDNTEADEDFFYNNNKMTSESRSSFGLYNKGRPLLIAKNRTVDDQIDEDENSLPAVTVSKSRKEKLVSNHCNEENMKNEMIYHEYVEDPTRFIFCEGLNRPRILTCPFNMKWSQVYQQCLMDS